MRSAIYYVKKLTKSVLSRHNKQHIKDTDIFTKSGEGMIVEVCCG